ncbi:MAG: hypothetical protein AAF298_20830 [Cyanobacteria bacterium P01_A01_bin.40]
MNSWELQDFNHESISGQIIEFNIFEIEYVMLFVPVDELYDSLTIEEKSIDLGITHKPNSFNVKFDLKANFESGELYSPPEQSLSVVKVRRLSETIRELVEFHYLNSNADSYLFVAENAKLKRFYDRLAKKYLGELQFTMKANLGEEDLGYEITTPRYKG